MRNAEFGLRNKFSKDDFECGVRNSDWGISLVKMILIAECFLILGTLCTLDHFRHFFYENSIAIRQY